MPHQGAADGRGPAPGMTLATGMNGGRGERHGASAPAAVQRMTSRGASLLRLSVTGIGRVRLQQSRSRAQGTGSACGRRQTAA